MARTDDPARQDRGPDRPGTRIRLRIRDAGVGSVSTSGTVRIGVAVSDPDGILATPVETVAAIVAPTSTCDDWRALIDEHEAVEVVVGLPRTLADRAGSSAQDAVELADLLAARISPVPIRLADERFTTVTAQRALREAGVRAKGQRSMIDQVAAVGILQHWLDQRRATLTAHGEVGDG